MQLSRTSFILSIFLTLLSTSLFAQEIEAMKIPKATLDFFRGHPKPDAEFASIAFINYRYYYQVDQQMDDGTVKLMVKVKVLPDSAKSYFDLSRVKEPYVANLLNHEQGHINIGYINGNRLRSALNLTVYSRNYNQEIKTAFEKYDAEFEKLQTQYDDETNHSIDPKAQGIWDEKIKLLLIESSKKDYKQQL